MPDQGPTPFGPEHAKECSRCGRPAVVTEVTVQKGEKVERKLCAECAAEAGISVQSNQPLEQIMTSILLSQQEKQQEHEDEAIEDLDIEGMDEVEEAEERPRQPAKRCGSCGLGFAEFRNKGLLGCADCYRHFEPALGPLLQRSHEGGHAHCGKVPSRAGEALDRQQRLQTLRRELQRAVEDESYEQAATLRDEIRTIENGRAPGAVKPVDEGGESA